MSHFNHRDVVEHLSAQMNAVSAHFNMLHRTDKISWVKGVLGVVVRLVSKQVERHIHLAQRRCRVGGEAYEVLVEPVVSFILQKVGDALPLVVEMSHGELHSLVKPPVG